MARATIEPRNRLDEHGSTVLNQSDPCARVIEEIKGACMSGWARLRIQQLVRFFLPDVQTRYLSERALFPRYH